MNQRPHETRIDLAGALGRASAIGVEEQRPVHDAVARNGPEAKEVREHRSRLAPAVQLIPAPDLAVTVAIRAIGELERNERIRFRRVPPWAIGEDLVDE